MKDPKKSQTVAIPATGAVEIDETGLDLVSGGGDAAPEVKKPAVKVVRFKPGIDIVNPQN